MKCIFPPFFVGYALCKIKFMIDVGGVVYEARMTNMANLT